MDFGWTDEQLELHESLAAFGARKLGEDILDRDREGRFSRDEWRLCAEFGVLGLPVPEEWGGSGRDLLTTMFAMEGLGYGCEDSGLVFGLNAQMWSVQAPILRFGSDEQKGAYVPALVGGAMIGAHCMTEPGSGSDAYGLQTSATLDGERYVLNGSKTFISNAGVADVFLVFATLDRDRGFFGITAFLVHRDTPGLHVGNPIAKLGLRTAPMCEVVFEDCEIPAESRLGREGNGGAIFKHSMLLERACILASGLGTLQRQLERTTEYARSRRQHGAAISENQAVSHRIVDMSTRLDAARLLLYRAGWLRDQGHEAAKEIAMAKLFLSEAMVRSSLDSVQIHGGYGYCSEYHVERDLRDSVGARIYSGTSEIQKEIIANALGL
jgi:alkylation response protein AidB-like acyl-CoA dehydrogenase